MRLSQTIAPALAALLVTACASGSMHASAPERAEQAEADKAHAQDEARQARLDEAKARQDAADAARARREADEKAQFAAQNAALAERDAQTSRTGVTEPQPVDHGVATGVTTGSAATGPYDGAWFSAGGYDLTAADRARLDSLIASLREHPSQKVTIDGYADDDNVKDENLSRHRAEAVASYLEKRGIASDRITTRVGTWSGTAVASDDSHRRAAAHRRVVIVVK